MGTAAATHPPLIYPWQQEPSLSETRSYPALADMLGGQCNLDGMPTPCSELSERMETGSVATEYLYRDSRNPHPGLVTRGGAASGTSVVQWITQTREIRSLGLGIFLMDYPYLERNNEGAGINWGEAVLDHHQSPQNPVMVPITDLKGLIKERLNYGDCKDAVANLINKAAELSNGKNDAISTDIEKLYGMIDSQPRGGFRPNTRIKDIPSYLPPKSGGKGLSWGNILRGNATAMIFLQGGFSDNPASLARIPYDYGITGIHEIIHLAGKNTSYSEDLLDQAARKFDPDSNFDNYLMKHCMPAKIPVKR